MPRSEPAEKITSDSLRVWLTDRLAKSLGCRAEEIDARLSFSMLGVDSLNAFSLTGELAQRMQQELPATLFWEYPTVDSLIQYLDRNRRPENE